MATEPMSAVWLNTKVNGKDTTVTFTGCAFTGKLSTALNGVDKTADLNDGYYQITGKKYTQDRDNGTLIIAGKVVTNH